MKVCQLAALTLVLGTITQPASAALMFNFNYADVTNATGMGFNDSTLGAARQSALESAASTLGAYFTNTATLNIDVQTSQFDGSGALASAGTSFFLSDNSFQQGFAQQESISNSLSGFTHGRVTWDFGYAYDLDDSVSAGTFDFKSIAMHELTHALGFASAIGIGGVSNFSGVANNMWTSFDQFLVDGDGNDLINQSTKSFNASEVADITGGAGSVPSTSNSGVYFDGANAVAANGGNLVPIYSPGLFNDGSSLSHLDTDFFGPNTTIMAHAISTGSGFRELSGIELGIMQDLGYSVAAVPVPAAIWLFGSGLLALFGVRRRTS